MGSTCAKRYYKSHRSRVNPWGAWGYMGLVLELGDLNPHYILEF